MKTSDNKQQQAAGFVTIVPKEESPYDKMIREKQEAQLEGCCDGGWQSRHDYKPRATTPASAPAEPPTLIDIPALPDIAETEKKNNKR